MSQNHLVTQMKQIRESYLDTLMKLISIEEEIEKAVFYFKKLEKSEREKVYSIYENYVKNLNVLRSELTNLMKDNMLTLNSLLNRIKEQNTESSKKVIPGIYSQVIDFIFNCYNPFFWYYDKKEIKDKK